MFYPPNGTGRDYYIILTNGGLTRNARELRKTDQTRYIESLRRHSQAKDKRRERFRDVPLGSMRSKSKKALLSQLKTNQRLLADRLSVPKSKHYWLPGITHSSITNRVSGTKRSLAKNGSKLKENRGMVANLESFCFKAKKIHMKSKKRKKKSRKPLKILKNTKDGELLFRSIITNRKTEFD